MVPETRVKDVCYTVMKPVNYEKTVYDCQLVEKQVPYTVSKCVPKMVTYQVPVQVLCKKPCAPAGNACLPAENACEPATNACEPAENCQ